MNRHEYRVKIVISVYQHLLLNKELKDCFKDNFDEDTNEYLITVSDDILNNIESYKNEIEPLLKNWTFSRLSYIDQAILIESLSELKLGINSKNIVIDEAIRIAKDYSDENSYKYINGVLDNL